MLSKQKKNDTLKHKHMGRHLFRFAKQEYNKSVEMWMDIDIA